ncbi:hypothetical protein NDU88_008372 [Pleurodeles waltl]|uniref:Uncharacterized protein n=1 Tax=Pleurodeles waltl TaxID=8319 RepID=A0AAV7QQI7_PLEWA|nr:hypothetical protein NDU88_008372 [Pleurodeles waltl]
MEQYTTPVSGLQDQTRVGGPGGVLEAPASAENPSCAELLAAIQGSRVVFEGKTEAVAVEVNLLWTDLRKVSNKVKVAEGSIVDLQGRDPVWARIGTGWAQFSRCGGGAGRAVLERGLRAPAGELDFGPGGDSRDALLVSCLEGCTSALSVGPTGVWSDRPAVELGFLPPWTLDALCAVVP